MPRQRQAPPSPISIPLPPNLTTSSSSSSSTDGIPLTSYLALPPAAPTPNFFLRLKRSASQLRSSSPTPAFTPALTPPVSPTPSALLSPALFPLPPTRAEEEERPFANLAPRSPTTGVKPWLELPTSGVTPYYGEPIAKQRSAAEGEESRWPLTPDSPYTPLKEPYSPARHSPSRHGKGLVFPHKPRITSNVFPTFRSPKQPQRAAAEVDDDSDVDAPISIGPASPRRHSTMDLPFLPSPPRSPARNGLLSPPELDTPATPQTPPSSRPRSMLAPSPPPTSALPPIPNDNALGLNVEAPATPPRSLRTTPRITPNAPARPRRIFSDYPALSTISPSKRVHFPNGPTSKRRPRTPFPPPRPQRAASVSSYASSSDNSDREEFDFSSSPKDSFETSDSSYSSIQSSRPSKSAQVTLHPPAPPPRPPRSPLRPISRCATPLPTLLLQPSAFPSRSEPDDDEEAILQPSRFLSSNTRAASRRVSAYSIGTVDSRELYAMMGFAQEGYGKVTGIRGVEQNTKLVDANGVRTRRGDNRHEENVVELGGLPENVRESFLRMKFEEEPILDGDEDANEEKLGLAHVSKKFVASGSQDSLDDTFVLEMTEKMLWG